MCYTSQTGSKTRSVTQWSLCGSLPLRVSYCIYLTYLTATKTKSTRVSCPWCWWYISTVTGLLSTALLQWSLYPCQHSRRQYCLSVSFSVGRLVECHELCRVEERMDIFQDPFLIHVQNTVTVVAITLLLYPSLYPDHSLHPYYVFGHAWLCHRFLEAQQSRRLNFRLCSSFSVHVSMLYSRADCTRDWYSFTLESAVISFDFQICLKTIERMMDRYISEDTLICAVSWEGRWYLQF